MIARGFKVLIQLVFNDPTGPPLISFATSKLIWTANIQLKCRIFMQLVAHSEVSCNFLQKIRPKTCISPLLNLLGKNDDERTVLILLHQPFSYIVWYKMLKV